MAIPIAESPVAAPTARGRVEAVPWPLNAVLVASTSVVIGLIWDISWHRTIGRDSFWTPAHLAIYLGGLTAGIACGWMVLRTTFAGSEEQRSAAVRFWGFRGPLGAWVCIWGTFAMLTSAPFDNWWHNAYGLDVQILSPPHAVLALGMIGVELGAMLMALAYQNRADQPRLRRIYQIMYAYAAAILLSMVAIMIMEYAAFPNHMRSGLFYKVTALAFPIVLVAAARGSTLRWPATTVAAIYLAINLAMIWILQLFPASPKLAPIYNPVTHMVPPPFPLLLIAPAAALDVLIRRVGSGRDWRLSAALGLTFVAVMLAVHWFWAEFLLSPAARNFAWGADQWNYSSHLGSWRYEYWDLDCGPEVPPYRCERLLRALAFAVATGVVASRLGLWWGDWMSRVKR